MGDTHNPYTFIINFGIIIVVGLVVLILELFGSPTRRGFFRDDETISYPYKGNTVSEAAIVLGGVVLPLIVIIVTELWTRGTSSSGRVRLGRLIFPYFIVKSGSIYGSYMLGLGLTQIISGVGKFTIGRLRPHFLAVCNPDIHSNVSSGYILDYTCLGDYSQVIEARLSFPSGHASISFYGCVYLMMYLQGNSKWSRQGFLRGLLQFLLILAAWWVSLSRVMDNWHHWSDVLAGTILGTISAYVAIKYLTSNEAHKQSSEQFLPLQTTNTCSPNSQSVT